MNNDLSFVSTPVKNKGINDDHQNSENTA